MLIGVGLVGVHANGVTEHGTFSLSGCRERTVEEFIANEQRQISEGAFVIDKVPAIKAYGPSVVMRAPLPDIDGKDTSTWAEVSQSSLVADTLCQSPDNGFGQLIRGADKGSTCLDTVPMAAYADYWRSHGARIGAVRGRSVVWEQA